MDILWGVVFLYGSCIELTGLGVGVLVLSILSYWSWGFLYTIFTTV